MKRRFAPLMMGIFAWGCVWGIGVPARAAKPTPATTRPPATSSPALSPADLVKAIKPLLGTEWSGVYLLGKKAGWMRSDFQRTEKGYEVRTKLHARFKTLGVEQTMEMEERRLYRGEKLRLAEIEFSQRMADRITAMTGEARGDRFLLRRTIAGQTTTALLDRPRESLADAMQVHLMAMKASIAPGTTFLLHQFDPTSGREYQEEVTFLRRERVVLEGVPTTVVTVRTRVKELGLTSTARLTTDGKMLEMKVGGLFVARREPEAVAKRLDLAVDPLAMSVIRLRRELPPPNQLSELVLRAEGIAPRYRVRTERQQYAPTDTPGVFTLTLKRSSWPKGPLPRGPFDDERIRAALASTPFVQSDHPDIRALARSIVGQETNTRKRVRKLLEWVYHNLKKRYTAALSSALDVLQTRSGDCTEHAILFVALCRAAGIPAQQVAGVVYGPGMGGFLYHAWARVYVGKWIEVDPTWNELEVNPTHIAFAIGPLEKQLALVSLIGQVRLHYVSHKKMGQ